MPEITTTTRWLFDWPQEDCLPLTPEELSTLRRQCFHEKIIGYFLAVISPLMFLIGLTLLAAPDIIGLSSRSMPFFLLAFFSLSVTPILFANECLRRAKMAKKDLHAGVKCLFAGILSSEMIQSPVIETLMNCGMLQPINSEQSIEVLASGRIWRVNRRAFSHRLSVTITEPADVPEIAHIAAQWLDPFQTPQGETVNAGRRELSKDEIDELRRLTRLMWQRGVWPAVLLSAWFLPLAFYSVSAGNMPPESGMFLLLTASTVASYISLILRVMIAYKIKQDIALGLVVIVAGPVGTLKGHPFSDLGEEQVVEFLPLSRFA